MDVLVGKLFLAAIAAVWLLVALIVGLLVRRRLKLRRRLRRHGVAVRGHVLGCSGPVAGGPAVLSVRITLPAGEQSVVRALSSGAVAAGAEAEVLYDPANPARAMAVSFVRRRGWLVRNLVFFAVALTSGMGIAAAVGEF